MNWDPIAPLPLTSTPETRTRWRGEVADPGPHFSGAAGKLRVIASYALDILDAHDVAMRRALAALEAIEEPSPAQERAASELREALRGLYVPYTDEPAVSTGETA